MDSDSVDAETYRRCLTDLARVNRVTLTHRASLRWLAGATRDLPRASRISILDVACGGGDLLRAIRRWADRCGRDVSLHGIDLNPRSLTVATAATPPGMEISYHTVDVFDYRPEPAPDFIVSSQFTHHLSDADVVWFLRWLEHHAARGWHVADLQRHAVPYYTFRIIATIARWNPIVRSDGTISIARSFRHAEWQRLLADADIPAQIRRHVPFRICVGRLK